MKPFTRRAVVILFLIAGYGHCALGMPSFDAVKADFRPSDTLILDRHGEVLQRIVGEEQGAAGAEAHAHAELPAADYQRCLLEGMTHGRKVWERRQHKTAGGQQAAPIAPPSANPS